MRNLGSILSLLMLFSSCGLYRYSFEPETALIVSKKGNSITQVYIKSDSGKTVAWFELIPGKKIDHFSLYSFSPDQFKCNDGCDFSFVPGRTYQIIILPMGDRMLLPIKIKVQPNGKIVELKY